jgi:hypothetical protein
MQKPQEIKELDEQFEAALVALRNLHTRAMELGVKDIQSASRPRPRCADRLQTCQR